ncbi:MAG TPA: patatin-like phospholipase family protein, partial [Gemmatimonadales bacterium]|nr:patatin-like phospholipase family protein [Gemmatimonadales bacterium]
MDALRCRDHCEIDAVFEGGGVRGIALLGAAAALESAGYRFQHLVGTSAGAIVAAFLAAGYSAQEILEISRQLDFTQFLDPAPRWLPRPLAVLWGACRYWGAYRGDRFLEWLREMLLAKGVRTFADLGPEQLRIVASDISRGRMVVFPDEASYYGIEPAQFEVALAVRASTAIPLFFRPVILKVREEPAYLVDGGLTSNMPIALCDGPNFDARPTFGILLKDYDPYIIHHRPRTIAGYLAAQFATSRSASDRHYLATHNYLRTIAIDATSVPVTAFTLPKSERDWLEKTGRDAALEFLRTWDFTEWRVVYASWVHTEMRAGATPTPLPSP